MQSFVEGETSSADYEYSARTSEGGHREPEIHSTATEKPLTENTELVDDIQMGDVKPTSTVEQRRYSAVWDPIRYITNLAIMSKQCTDRLQPPPT